MPDMSRPEAIHWLVNNPPRTFPPPDGWAWCHPDDRAKPWSLFSISMGKDHEDCDEICETVRDMVMCDLSRINIDALRCHRCDSMQLYDVDSQWESYVCADQSGEGGS